MTDSLILYRTLIEFVWQNGVRFHDLRCLITFVWAIVGLLLSQEIHLSQWLLYRPGPAKAGSKQRQLARWLHNVKISPSQVYEPLIGTVLGAWAGQQLYLALDSSLLWNRFALVRLALIPFLIQASSWASFLSKRAFLAISSSSISSLRRR